MTALRGLRTGLNTSAYGTFCAGNALTRMPTPSRTPDTLSDITSVADAQTAPAQPAPAEHAAPSLHEQAPETFFTKHVRLTRLGCVLAMVAVGWVIGQVSQPGVQTWYPLLSKPSLTPPDWVFGVVWTTLYILMGAGLARLLSYAPSDDEVPVKRRALTVYGAQLLANFAWNPLFFIGQSTWLAAAWIFVVLWLTVWSVMECLRLDRMAALLLAPTVAWVSFACYLMTWIYLNN